MPYDTLESLHVVMTSMWNVSEALFKRKLLKFRCKRLFKLLDKAYQEGKINWIDHDDLVEELWLTVHEANCKWPATPGTNDMLI